MVDRCLGNDWFDFDVYVGQSSKNTLPTLHYIVMWDIKFVPALAKVCTIRDGLTDEIHSKMCTSKKLHIH